MDIEDAGKLAALVMAGGRLSGRDADAAGAEIKALAEIGGEPVIQRVLRALEGVDAVDRIVVVGPEPVRPFADEARGAVWESDTPTLLGNVQAGARIAAAEGYRRVLLIGSDLATPQAGSIAGFLARSPREAQVTVPLVSRGDYEAAYPGSPSTFVALKEGEFTIGSHFVAPVRLLLDPPAAVAAVLGNRKSQLQMARRFGFGFLLGLMRRSLTIGQLERRASEMLGAPAAAVRDCAPDLAFDVDDARDFAYARSLLPPSR